MKAREGEQSEWKSQVPDVYPLLVYDSPKETSLHEEIPGWLSAVRAAEAKQAVDIKVLDLSEVTSFTDHFVICTGSNTRQCQAIADEIGLQLKVLGELPTSLEGYDTAEWILADYGDFLVHVFSPASREYYSLERLWRAGKEVPLPVE